LNNYQAVRLTSSQKLTLLCGKRGWATYKSWTPNTDPTLGDAVTDAVSLLELVPLYIYKRHNHNFDNGGCPITNPKKEKIGADFILAKTSVWSLLRFHDTPGGRNDDILSADDDNDVDKA